MNLPVGIDWFRIGFLTRFFPPQFVIVGVVRESIAYSKIKSEEIKLLDVIESINDTDCGKIFTPALDADLQECFEHYVGDKDNLRLVINHSYSVPQISGSRKLFTCI